MSKELKNDKIYIGNLLAYYDKFLTEKQLAYMQLYFQEDYSLQEIAEVYDVTRVAIHNQLQNAQKKLIDFEENLHLYQLHSEIIPLFEEGMKQKNWRNIEVGLKKMATLLEENE